jgi:hypothetical protein
MKVFLSHSTKDNHKGEFARGQLGQISTMVAPEGVVRDAVHRPMPEPRFPELIRGARFG